MLPFPLPPSHACTVYINNSDAARYIIKNMTQGRALQAVKESAAPVTEAAAAELLDGAASR